MSWESVLEKEDERVFLYSHKTINYPPLTSSWIHSQSCLDWICIFSHFSGEKNGKLDKNGTVGYAFPMIMRPLAAPSILNLLNHQVSENCYIRNSQRTPESAGVFNNNHYTSLITTARETLEKKSSLSGWYFYTSLQKKKKAYNIKANLMHHFSLFERKVGL